MVTADEDEAFHGTLDELGPRGASYTFPWGVVREKAT